jgi:hypothetical protein
MGGGGKRHVNKGEGNEEGINVYTHSLTREEDRKRNRRSEGSINNKDRKKKAKYIRKERKVNRARIKEDGEKQENDEYTLPFLFTSFSTTAYVKLAVSSNKEYSFCTRGWMQTPQWLLSPSSLL